MQHDLANPPKPSAHASSGAPPERPRLGRAQSSRRPDRQKRKLDQKARDLNADFVNEDDLVVFAQALRDDPHESLTENGIGPEKISAVSDFAPIKEKIKRPKRQKDIVREGWAYHVSRWPLLMVIFALIFVEFLFYLLVRQLVNVFEYISGLGGKQRRLRQALRAARTFEDWKAGALALDKHLHLNDWKKQPAFAYYDHSLIRRVLRTLKDLRSKNDVEGVSAVLYAALRNNFGGVEGFRLYSETYYGTKELVEEYAEEVARSVEFVKDAKDEFMSLDEKAAFFRSSAKNLGASALCLSGGASFGYYHFGVVRALLDENLLPRVITGTSAGAIVAALTCTRTDEELRLLLVPELANRISACSEGIKVWGKRAWKTGARFDTLNWARKASFFTLGNMTFKEAFERTGRILNVSVIPYDTHSPTKLLNYLTAPDCVIYTAVIASAAVPGILNPVVLMTKDKDGKVHPWDFQGKHKDGSLRVDIPLEQLHRVYNVNYSIVSQVNPHIHLFHFAPRGAPGRPVSHRKGKGWRGGFFLSAAEQFLKLELTKNFRVIRDLELFPELGGQNWSTVFLQKFEGSVTIWPRSRARDWVRILTDPDPDELERMIRVGQRVTWPKIKMIQNRLKIERQVDAGRDLCHRELEKKSAGVGSSSNLLLPTLNRSNTNETSVDPDEGSSLASSRASSSTEDVRSPASGLQSPAPENGGRDPSPASIARRRKRILAKLGLVHAAPPSIGGTPNGSDSEHTSGGSTRGGAGLRRNKFEMGSLKRKMRRGVRSSMREGVTGGSTSEEDGTFVGFESDEGDEGRAFIEREEESH